MKDIIEILDFDDEKKRKVGRPKLADKETKKKSLIYAGVSFLIVIILLVFGYGSLIGFNNSKLLASIFESKPKENILIKEIKPIIKNITLKENTIRKVYLTVSPSNSSNKNIKYTSSDNSIVKVDNNGRVTGISVGNAIITAITKDGSNKKAVFNITVIKNASGMCEFSSLSKNSNSVSYNIDCDNAKIKEIKIKTDGDYKTLTTNKKNGEVKLSKDDMKKKITFKVAYYPNNSKITKYSTRELNNVTTTTKKIDGNCKLTIKEVNKNSCKYDINCKNASVEKIAYKIGNGSYVGLDKSNLADTIIFEESDVTRIIYFNVDYKIDGSKRINTITESSIIEKGKSKENIEEPLQSINN